MRRGRDRVPRRPPRTLHRPLSAAAARRHWPAGRGRCVVLIGTGNLGLALASGSGLGALVLALAVTGAGFGLFEIAVNGAAMDWEALSGRSVLNSLHAGYSGGAVVGAVGAGVLLGLGWRPDGILLLTALCSLPLIAATVVVRFPPSGLPAPAAPAGSPGPPGSPAGGLRRALAPLRPLRPLLPLAGAAALASVGESVANLWSVIYLAELGAGSLLGGAAFALANAAMLAGRLVNARVVARLGTATSLHLSGAGLILASAILFLPGLPWLPGDDPTGRVPLAVAGFGLLGLAVAGVVPTALTAGARLVPGNSGAVAGALMTAVYLAFVVAPPLVGWLAEASSLRAALLVVALSGVGIIALTRKESDGAAPR
ncbi:MAG TPA: MFS transporter [Chloroflexota bacterium]|nr:MFS transporter [Chloroflexota bacterium]